MVRKIAALLLILVVAACLSTTPQGAPEAGAPHMGAIPGIVFIQRIGDGSGVLAPQERAFALPTGWTITDVPSGSLSGNVGGPGQVTGYSQFVAPSTIPSQTIAVPALGSASFTNGADRWTSARLTTTTATPTVLVALPMAANDYGIVRFDVLGFDTQSSNATAAGKSSDTSAKTGGAYIGSSVLTATGEVASPALVGGIGYGSTAQVSYAAGLLVVAVNGPFPGCTGTTDITAGGLYGAGTLTGKTLALNVNGAGATTLTWASGGNAANEAAMLAAIVAQWPAITAAQGGPGANKLVLQDTTATAGSIVVGAGTSNGVLGLTAGTYGQDAVSWIGTMRISAVAE